MGYLSHRAVVVSRPILFGIAAVAFSFYGGGVEDTPARLIRAGLVALNVLAACFAAYQAGTRAGPTKVADPA
jgi:phosphoglycerol transferase MdoB-like AlkP superfamily enzyme